MNGFEVSGFARASDYDDPGKEIYFLSVVLLLATSLVRLDAQW